MCKWPKNHSRQRSIAGDMGNFFSGKIRDFGALLHYFYDVFHQNNKAGESELTGPGGQAI